MPLLTDLPVSTPQETSSNPPAAHEDLTIAESLETMRVADEHRPGECLFVGSNGRQRWISTAELGDFVGRFGSTHPSNYLATHGIDWEDNFFKTKN